MDELRQNILKQAEDNWQIVLLDFQNNLKTKKFFREQFNLEFLELKEWMTPGKILCQNVSLAKASSMINRLEEHKIITDLIQTGNSYHNLISKIQIIEALEIPSLKVDDYCVTSNGLIMINQCAILIEEQNLATACLKYLLENKVAIK